MGSEPKLRLLAGGLACSAALAVAACGDAAADAPRGATPDFSTATGTGTGTGTSGSGTNSTATSTGTGTGPIVRPPETENEARYLAPVATGKYLWTANPLSGKVAVIDATTLTVRLDAAGDGPTEVAGLPELDGH